MPRPITKANAKELRHSLAAIDADDAEALRAVNLGAVRRIIHIWETFSSGNAEDERHKKELTIPVTDKSTVTIYYADLLFALYRVERFQLRRERRKNISQIGSE